MKWYKRILNDDDTKFRWLAGLVALALLGLAVTSELVLTSINKKVAGIEGSTMTSEEVSNVITEAFGAFQEHNPTAPVPEVLPPVGPGEDPAIKIRPPRQTPSPAPAAQPGPQPKPTPRVITRNHNRVIIKRLPPKKTWVDRLFEPHR